MKDIEWAGRGSGDDREGVLVEVEQPDALGETAEFPTGVGVVDQGDVATDAGFVQRDRLVGVGLVDLPLPVLQDGRDVGAENAGGAAS